MNTYSVKFEYLIFNPLSCFAYQTDGLTIISENDWKLFCQDWGGLEARGIIAEIECLENDLVISCDEMQLSEDHMSVNGEPNIGIESRKPIIKTLPEVILGIFPSFSFSIVLGLRAFLSKLLIALFSTIILSTEMFVIFH